MRSYFKFPVILFQPNNLPRSIGEMAEERKRDTRRKILAGAYVIKLAENDLKKLGRELINAGMLEPRDYALFGVDNDSADFDSNRLSLD